MINETTKIALAILKTNSPASVLNAARRVVTANLDLILFRPNIESSASRGHYTAQALEQRKPYEEAYRRSVAAFNDALKRVSQ